MKNKNIVVKSIAFNAEDPDQQMMLEHATKRTNFSSYIKRLIQRDLEGGYVPQSNEGFKEMAVESGFEGIDPSAFV